MARFHNIPTLLILSLMISYSMAITYPSWLVLVTVKCDGSTDRCLGAVVADDHIVTAARCFNRCPMDSATIRVYTGLSRNSRNVLVLGDKMRRADVTIHPDYDASSNLNDIALIKVDCLSSDIIRLQPVEGCSLFNNATEYRFCDLQNRKTLVEYNVTRSRKKDCNKEHAGTFTGSQMVCFKKSQCSDNTVGLAVRDNKLFAMSSFGLGCPVDGEQSYENFASLDVCKYSSWIKTQVSKEGDADECNKQGVGSTTAATTATSAPTTAPTTATTATPDSSNFLLGCRRQKAPKFGTITLILNVALFGCYAGYRLDGAVSIGCVAGVWSGKRPKCRPIKCPILKNIPNGQVEVRGNTVNSTAVYTCSEGYTLNGYRIRLCDKDGNWEGSPPICQLTSKVFCEDPGRISCGSRSLQGALTDGSTFTYHASPGAQLVGPTTITCNNGKWSAPAPQCRYLCNTDHINIENGKYELEYPEGTLDYKLKFTCDDGYTGNFYDEYICSNGLWKVTPTNARCVATCPTIKIGNNGSIRFVDAGVTKYAIVNCNSNYRNTGSPVLSCTNGVWNGLMPSCVPH